MLLTSLEACAEIGLYPIFDFSGGWYTNASPERIPENATPDCLNVEFDRDLGFTSRNGSINYLNSAIPELQPIRAMFQYIQTDGDRYIIANSSSSVYYSVGDGNATSIVSGLNSAYTDTYTTALNYLYRDNGYDDPGKWDGATYTPITVANSTSVPKGRLQVYYKDHLFKAGVDGGRSTLYWSVVNKPDDFGSYGSGSKFVGKDDGDVITGLLPFGDRLIITKNYSTSQLVGTDANTWLVRPVSNNIGCLYQSTMALYKGQYPMWVSDRGVELFDGVSLTLVSEPVDNYIKALRQLNINSEIWTQDTAADWGAGSGTNIDTTTYSGSVAISESKGWGALEKNISGGTATELNFGTNSMYAQTFYCDGGFVSEVQVNVYSYGGMTLKVGIGNSNFAFIASQTRTFADGAVGYQSFTFSTTTLTANTTYSIIVQKTDGTDANDYIYKFSDGTYAKGTAYTYSFPGTWTQSATDDLGFYVYGTTFTCNAASYTSQILTATSWGSWGAFTAGNTVPSGSAISYYVKTSTASDNFASKPLVSVTNGGAINSTTGNYIQVIASFTRTDATVVPKLDDFNITYYQTNGNNPQAIAYKDAYYLSVSTGDNSTINNVILKFDKNMKWTIFNNLNMGSACLFRSDLMMGSGQNAGMIHKLDVSGIYADSGNAYQSYITTKILDLGSPIQQKQFFSRWINAKNSGDWSIYYDYRLDGSTGDWTTGTVDLSDSDNLIFKKLNFADKPKANYIQLRINNNTVNQHFNVRGLSLIYDTFPLE